MKKVFLIFSLTFFSIAIKAQTLDIKWSDPIVADKVDGEFSGIMFSSYNLKHIYIDFAKAKTSKFALYDENTLKRISIHEWDNSDSKEMKDLNLYELILLQKIFFYFYYKEYKGVKELYMKIRDLNFNIVSPVRKVDGFISKNEDAEKSELFILGNKNAGEKIIIGKDISADNSKNITLQYKIFDDKFSLISEKQVILPFGIDRKKYSIKSTYKLGLDGNLHIESKVKLNSEHELKEGESRTNILYSVVNYNTGNVRSYPIKSEGKDLYLFRYIENEKSIKLFGFFFDPSKGNDRIDIHGVYYASIDSKTLNMDKDFTFTYFTKEQSNELFSKDTSLKDASGIFTYNKLKYSQEEQLSGEYAIEQIQFINDESLVLFCSIMHNYSIPSRSQASNFNYNERNCAKRNVGAIKINMEGRIEWASNLKRFINYGGSSVSDLKVIYKEDKFYVLYGADADDMKKDKTTDKNNTQKNETKDGNLNIVEYGVFDYHTGKYEKKKCIINKAGIEKSFRKNFSFNDIEIINNEFFTHSQFFKPLDVYKVDNDFPAYLGKFIIVK